MIPITGHTASPGESAVVTGALAAVGTLVGSINPWLQAGAYVVSMAVGVCALVKFWRDRK